MLLYILYTKVYAYDLDFVCTHLLCRAREACEYLFTAWVAVIATLKSQSGHPLSLTCPSYHFNVLWSISYLIYDVSYIF